MEEKLIFLHAWIRIHGLSVDLRFGLNESYNIMLS